MFDGMSEEEVAALPYVIEGDSSDREAWLDQRRRMLTASDVGSVLGMNPYHSELALWEEKIGRAPEREVTAVMEAGLRLEPVTLKWFNDKTKRKCVPAGKLLRHRKMPWLGATLDAWDPDNQCPLELKFTTEFNRAAWDECFSELYSPQLHAQMLVTGTTHATIAVLVGGWDLKWQDVKADPAMFERIRREGYAFAEKVRDKVQPSADGSKSAAEVLRRLWPNKNEEVISLSPEMVDVAEEIDQLSKLQKDAKDRWELLRQKICEAMGEHTMARCPDGSGFSWNPNKAGKRTLLRKKAKAA